MALVIVLGPILEADLPGEQYAYREHRSARDAIRAVHGLVNRGSTRWVREFRGAQVPKGRLKPCAILSSS